MKNSAAVIMTARPIRLGLYSPPRKTELEKINPERNTERDNIELPFRSRIRFAATIYTTLQNICIDRDSDPFAVHFRSLR